MVEVAAGGGPGGAAVGVLGDRPARALLHPVVSPALGLVSNICSMLLVPEWVSKKDGRQVLWRPRRDEHFTTRLYDVLVELRGDGRRTWADGCPAV